eukprot:scaffold14654_cov50-Cyclotella_meneghiniana.AAC.12
MQMLIVVFPISSSLHSYLCYLYCFDSCYAMIGWPEMRQYAPSIANKPYMINTHIKEPREQPQLVFIIRGGLEEDSVENLKIGLQNCGDGSGFG